MSASRVDEYGESLPSAALARSGSSRWYHRGERVFALLFSDDGNTLYAGSPEGLTAFDVATGLPRWSHHNTDSVDLALAPHPDGPRLVSVGYGGAAHFFDPATGAWKGRVPLDAKKANNLYGVAVSRDASALFVVGLGPFARLLHADGTPRLALQTKPPAYLYTRCLFAPDGRSALMMRARGNAGLWSTDDGSPVWTLAEDDPTSACFSPDGASLYVGLGNGDVVRYEPSSGVEVSRWKAHNAAVQHLAITSDGAHLFSLGDAESIKRWSLSTLTATASLAVPTFASAFALSADGRTVASSSLGRVWVARADDLHELAPRRPEEVSYVGLAAARDGRTVATLTGAEALWCSPDTLVGEGAVAVGPLTTHLGLRRVPGGDRCAFLLPAGRGWQRLDLAARAASTFDAEGDNRWWGQRAEGWLSHKKLTLRNADGATHILRGLVWSVGFSPDDAFAFVLLVNKVLCCDLRRHAEAWSAEAHHARSLWVSPDGREVLAEGELSAWRFATSDGRLLATHARPDGSAAPLVAYAPDGRHVAVGCFTEVMIVDCAANRVAGWLDGHRAELTGLAFSADGARVYTASRDTTVIAWSLEEALAAGPARREFEAAKKKPKKKSA